MNATAQASVASITGPKLDNRRVMAALVDLAIVVAGSLVILVAADALSGDRGGALVAVILGWALYYYFALESGDGQTVGKKLLKLRVVRADGRPAGMREIAMRTVLRVVDGIGAYIVGLIVMLATGQRRQRLGDLAAGTIVVDASAPAYVPPAPAIQPAAKAPVEDAPAGDAPVENEPPAYEPVEDEPVEDAPASYEPVENEPVAYEPVEDAPVEDAPVEDEPVAYEPPAEDEPVEDEAVAVVEIDGPVENAPTVVVQLDEPTEDEPLPPVAIVEVADPVEDEPVAPVAPVAVLELAKPLEDDEPVEDEPVLTMVEPLAEEESLPEVSTPSLQQLARDVDAARTDPVPVVEVVQPVEDEPEDEPMTLKSVETVSAIDLVMGGASEDEDEPDQASEGPAAS